MLMTPITSSIEGLVALRADYVLRLIAGFPNHEVLTGFAEVSCMSERADNRALLRARGCTADATFPGTLTLDKRNYGTLLSLDRVLETRTAMDEPLLTDPPQKYPYIFCHGRVLTMKGIMLAVSESFQSRRECRPSIVKLVSPHPHTDAYPRVHVPIRHFLNVSHLLRSARFFVSFFGSIRRGRRTRMRSFICEKYELSHAVLTPLNSCFVSRSFASSHLLHLRQFFI